MISQTHKPLSQPQAKQIQKWLQDPACRLYMDFIAAKAAEHTADAGNKLVESAGKEEPEAEAARECAAKAKEFVNAYKIMDSARADDYKFETVELKSQITSPTESE